MTTSQTHLRTAAGALFCCTCQHETELFIHQLESNGGIKQVFDSPRCHQCKHIPCNKCVSTDIFRHLSIEESEFKRESDEKKLCYCILCPQCGMAWREVKPSMSEQYVECDPPWRSVSYVPRCEDCELDLEGLKNYRFAIYLAASDWRDDPEACRTRARKRLQRLSGDPDRELARSPSVIEQESDGSVTEDATVVRFSPVNFDGGETGNGIPVHSVPSAGVRPAEAPRCRRNAIADISETADMDLLKSRLAIHSITSE